MLVTRLPCLPAGHELRAAVQINPEGLPGRAFITYEQKQSPKGGGAMPEGWGDCCSWGRHELVCICGMEQGQDVQAGTHFISSDLGLRGGVSDPDEGRAYGGQEAISIFLYFKASPDRKNLAPSAFAPCQVCNCPLGALPGPSPAGNAVPQKENPVPSSPAGTLAFKQERFPLDVLTICW